MCKEMVNEEHKSGFLYKELPDVARVLELSFRGIQHGKVHIAAATLILMM